MPASAETDAVVTATAPEVAASVCFAAAVIHGLSAQAFRTASRKFARATLPHVGLHALGEIELVFGLWAIVFLIVAAFLLGAGPTAEYLASCDFTEPMFVVVIMTICSSRPLLAVAEQAIRWIARRLPGGGALSFYVATLVVGPILGSVITEPAAMTVTASILLHNLYRQKISANFRYATLGLLFVNVSIGGTLTPFAAPPVLMVAKTWDWDVSFMLVNFGWRAIAAIALATVLTTWNYRRELIDLTIGPPARSDAKIPRWTVAAHATLLAAVIHWSHDPRRLAAIFAAFLLLAFATKTARSVRIKGSALVGLFLAGLVILGGRQGWWLEPLLGRMTTLPLYFGATALTAITDNAALTYLGSLVPNLPEASKYALVAGSVVGGGLTIIANAPNPAGASILNDTFGEDGIGARQLFASALRPTLIAAICLLPIF